MCFVSGIKSKIASNKTVKPFVAFLLTRTSGAQTTRGKKMTLRNIVLCLSIVDLSGCSILAYTPVVTTSVLGINQTDLSNDPKYKGFINRPFHLSPLLDKSWQLKKFDRGRYYIEVSIELSKNKVICDLGVANIVIVKIFDDSISGGVFYSAEVTCDTQVFDAPLNHWSDSLMQSVKFADERST